MALGSKETPRCGAELHGILIRSQCDQTTLFEYESGNGERYVLTLTDLSQLPTSAKSAMGFNASRMLVQVSLLVGGRGRTQMAEFGLRPSDESHWASHVLDLSANDADAKVLGDLLDNMNRRVPDKELSA